MIHTYTYYMVMDRYWGRHSHPGVLTGSSGSGANEESSSEKRRVARERWESALWDGTIPRYPMRLLRGTCHACRWATGRELLESWRIDTGNNTEGDL